MPPKPTSETTIEPIAGVEEVHARLLAPFHYHTPDAGSHKLHEGYIFSSFAFDLDRMAKQGAKLEILDNDGAVIGTYSEYKALLAAS